MNNNCDKPFQIDKKTMGQEGLIIVIHEKRIPPKENPGRYNAQIVNEVAVLSISGQIMRWQRHHSSFYGRKKPNESHK